MAKRNKTGGKDFERGVSGNPMGAALHNQDLKAVKRMTKDEVADVGRLLLEGNVSKIRDVHNDPESSVLKVWICSVAIKAIERGDAQALNAILDRVVGKVTDELNVTGSMNQNVIMASTDQVKEILQKIQDEY